VASRLREDLETAGITRPALLIETPTTAHLTFHNLRDTCLTHMAVRRDPPHDVQWRAGHTTLAMTEKYIAEARYEAGPSFGEPLAPLPTVVINPDADDPAAVIESVIVVRKPGKKPVKVVEAPGIVPRWTESTKWTESAEAMSGAKRKGRAVRPALEQWWRRRESNPGPKISRPTASTCVSGRLSHPNLRGSARSPRD